MNFYFNLGDSQDQDTLIGNTHFDKNKGTYFSESSFVQNKNSQRFILLDELSRISALNVSEHPNECS